MPVDAGDLGDLQRHLSRLDQGPHLVDGVGGGAELVAAVHQGQRLRQRLQVDGPVEGGIAAAGDHQPLAAELLHTAHRIEHALRSEEHTSELQSLMRISYAVFCLKKKKHKTKSE